MTATRKMVVEWQCDVCAATRALPATEAPGGAFPIDEPPEGWGRVSMRAPRYSEIKNADVCDDCIEELASKLSERVQVRANRESA